MRQFIATDPNLRHLAEAGVDAVHPIALRHDVVDQFVCFRDAASRVIAERDRHSVLPYGPQIGQRHELVFDDEIHDPLPVSIIGKFRPFSRAQSMAIS